MKMQLPNMSNNISTDIPNLATDLQTIDTEFAQRAVNVMWYGAKGDGVTDDTTAIQNAINAAGQFGVVYFPLPTSCYLVGQLSPLAGQTLIGQASGRMGYEDKGVTLKLKNGANTNVLNIASGVQYGKIINLQIDGNKANQTASSCGIYIADNGTGIDAMWNIERCYIHHCYSDGIYIGLNMRAVRVIDNEILNNGNNGVTVKAPDCQIQRNDIGLNGAQGIYVGAWVTRIMDNDVYNNGAAGIMLDSGSDLSVVIGNGIDRNNNQGINCNSSNVTIIGNVLHTNSQSGNDQWASIDVQASCSGVTITGNKFEFDAGYTNTPTWDINIHPGATSIIRHGNTYTSSAHVQGHCSDGQAWTASTAYSVGQTVNTGGNVYQCITAGTSGTTAPSGTGSSITDGTVTWAYVAPLQMLKFMGSV
jgi:hypothetical protein